MAITPYDPPRGRQHMLVDVTRRQFFVIMAWMASLAATLFGGIKVLGFMFPGATLEAPALFKVDADPSTIQKGSAHSITDKRVTIVHDDAGYYAVYLICTHLGCTPNYTTTVTQGTGVAAPVAKA